MEYVTSQRGKKLLCFGGFVYSKDRARDTSTYWRCAVSDCNGRAVTKGDVFNVTRDHNHAPDPADVEARKCFDRIRVAAEGHAKTASIVNREVAQKVSLSSQGALPKEASIKRRIQRQRRKNFPQLPTSAKEINLEGKWRETESGEDWVVFNEQFGESDQIVIFATNKNIETAALSKVWYGDGTFDVTPPFFTQLYTIHCEYMGRVLPMIYCLLPRKTRVVYETMFLAIRMKMAQVLPGFDPCVEKFRMDFECAAYQAAVATFPSAIFEGCFFHFCQANWRKIVNCGFRQRYIDDPEFAILVKEFTALSFLPDAKIKDAFYMLKEAAIPELEDYVLYFENTYIGTYKTEPTGNSTQVRLVWKEPIYSPAKWSVHQRVLDDDPRTTNFLEGWHRRFSVVVGESHPNIYKFIEVLLGEQAHTEMTMMSLLRGDSNVVQTKKEQLKNKRIKAIILDHSRSIMDTLKGVAFNIQYRI